MLLLHKEGKQNVGVKVLKVNDRQKRKIALILHQLLSLTLSQNFVAVLRLIFCHAVPNTQFTQIVTVFTYEVSM